GDRASQPSHDLCRQLEAQVHALRSDVEEQIARCRRGAALSRKNLTKLSQLGRPRLPEQLVPRFRSHRHDAGKASLEFAKPRRTDQRGEVLAQATNDISILGAWIDRYNEKNRSPGQRRSNGLRDCIRIGGRSRRHRRRFPWSARARIRTGVFGSEARESVRTNLRGHSFSVLGSAIRRSRPLGPDSSWETAMDAKRGPPPASVLIRVHRSRLHIFGGPLILSVPVIIYSHSCTETRRGIFRA